MRIASGSNSDTFSTHAVPDFLARTYEKSRIAKRELEHKPTGSGLCRASRLNVRLTSSPFGDARHRATERLTARFSKYRDALTYAAQRRKSRSRPPEVGEFPRKNFRIVLCRKIFVLVLAKKRTPFAFIDTRLARHGRVISRFRNIYCTHVHIRCAAESPDSLLRTATKRLGHILDRRKPDFLARTREKSRIKTLAELVALVNRREVLSSRLNVRPTSRPLGDARSSEMTRDFKAYVAMYSRVFRNRKSPDSLPRQRKLLGNALLRNHGLKRE